MCAFERAKVENKKHVSNLLPCTKTLFSVRKNGNHHELLNYCQVWYYVGILKCIITSFNTIRRMYVYTFLTFTPWNNWYAWNNVCIGKLTKTEKNLKNLVQKFCSFHVYTTISCLYELYIFPILGHLDNNKRRDVTENIEV